MLQNERSPGGITAEAGGACPGHSLLNVALGQVPNNAKRRQGLISPHEVERWITAPRFKAFSNAVGGDHAQAVALYDWNICVSALFFEALSYAEVLLRNAIDAQFQPLRHEEPAATSWLCDPAILTPQSLERVTNAILNIERMNKQPTRARVVANLSFGFWRALTDKRYKQLWIERLHRAFPNGTGDRREVARLLSGLNPFRNRLAHHEPIINASIAARHEDLIELTRLIDRDAALWLESRSCVPRILKWRPPLQGRKRAMGLLGLAPRTVHFHTHR